MVRKKWKHVREIKELITLSVSGSGGGLYLYLPKKLIEQYDINAGDRVKVQLRDLFKRDYQNEDGSYAQEANRTAKQRRRKSED